MDPNLLELAQKIGAFLLPLLPYLLNRRQGRRGGGQKDRRRGVGEGQSAVG